MNIRRFSRGFAAVAALALAFCLCAPVLSARKAKAPKEKSYTRLLYWNIQNGMWSGQGENYAKFVKWVGKKSPDICVWCEAQPIFNTGAGTKRPDEKEFRHNDGKLIGFWKEMAARYGHEYVFLGGHRDNYPQVITSRYPIVGVDRIVGEEPDSIVAHGAGWAYVTVRGKKLNIVTLHTYPHAWAPGTPKSHRAEARKNHAGDRYRATEMKYIIDHTYKTSPTADQEYWMMMGDFNSRSRVDNGQYGYPVDDPRFLCQDVILKNTRYIDVISRMHPGEFITSTGGKSRIDYVYLTKPLFDRVLSAEIVSDGYTTPVRDPQKISNFWHPSDHRPIVVDFDLKD